MCKQSKIRLHPEDTSTCLRCRYKNTRHWLTTDWHEVTQVSDFQHNMCVLSPVVWQAGMQGVQAHSQKFWFVKNPGKSLKIWEKSLKIFTKSLKIWAKSLKIRVKWCPTLCIFKNWHLTFAEKRHTPKVRIKRRSSWYLWEKMCRQKSLGKFGQKYFTSSTIFLLLHLCLSPSHFYDYLAGRKDCSKIGYNWGVETG